MQIAAGAGAATTTAAAAAAEAEAEVGARKTTRRNYYLFTLNLRTSAVALAFCLAFSH